MAIQGPPTLAGGTQGYPLIHAVTDGRITYYNGTDRWDICCEVTAVGANPNLVAYKNAVRIIVGPAVQAGTFSFGVASVAYKGSGTTVQVGYQAPTGNLWVISLDMSSGTFGTAHDSGQTLPINGDLANLVCVVQPSGNPTLIYNQVTLGVYATTYSGSWNSPVKINDNSQVPWYLENAGVDGDGNVGVLFSPNTIVFRSGNKQYARYSGTAVLDRTDTGLAANNDTGRICTPFYDSVSNKMAFPLIRDTPTGVCLLIVSTPATPTFAMKLVWAFGLSTTSNIDFVQVTGNSAGNKFSVFWERRVNLFNNDVVDQTSCTTLTGTWSAPVRFWDMLTAPPATPVAFGGIRPLFINSNSAGNIAVVVGVQTFVPEFWFGTLFTWVPLAPSGGGGPAVGTLTLAVAVVGGPAVPSNWSVFATGPVSLPLTAGGVPATVISPGTYVLGVNSGPPGYSAVWSKTGGGTLAGNVLTLGIGDSAVCTCTQTFGDSGLTIKCVLSGYTVGVPYNQTFIITGGTPPFTFALTGTLPDGLAFDPTTGTISGTPLEEGIFPYSITVTSS